MYGGSHHDSVVTLTERGPRVSNFGWTGSEIERGISRFMIAQAGTAPASVEQIKEYVAAGISEKEIEDHLIVHYHARALSDKKNPARVFIGRE
jgi:hypothetical protein